jgi:hypothetical protein
MKKILHILCLCLVTYFSKAQDQSQHQLFLGSAAVDYSNTANNLQMQMQIGNPVFSSLNTGALQARVGFPYGILYISPTFVIDGFEVSKGYFTDKVNIKWTLGNNQDKIEKINIFRKKLGGSNSLQLIGSVGKDIFEYDDTQVEGGVLYEYKIEAVGVSAIEQLYTTFIKGVGFRNPTATISGSVTYEGGSPVQDVVVFAEANGVESNASGSSLKIDDGFISIDNIEYDIFAKNLTLQSWVTAYGGVFKFSTSGGYNVILKAGKVDANSIEFEIYVSDFLIRKITLSNSYPTGELDFLGNDVFNNISELTATSFLHVSAVLENLKTPKFYVNGREITQDYIDTITVKEEVTKPTFTFENHDQFIYGFNSVETQKLTKLTLGENYIGYLDEVRVWQRLLSNEEIRRDYRRYLSGAETDLSIYLRLDENAGNNVYDLSRKGFRQNKNDGYFAESIAFSDTKPTRQQLGVFGVTDANGAYTISSISFTGTGESFVITPSLGVHKFEPASQTVFLGAEASVVNQLNFTDISSFKFNGRAVYNVQNVFNTIALEGDELTYTDIKYFGYNKYRVSTSNDAEITINKGEYYYEGGAVNNSNGFYENGTLKRYPVIGLADAFIYIDGDIVIGANNQPVKTDAEGKFSVNVPIGQHNVEVRKEGHTFTHNGFFPALDTFEFFEDQIEETWFIDATRISLVGKVVGGRIESDKPIGFGLNGELSYLNNEGEENEEKEIISSKNNIGIATIILKGDIETNNLDVSVATDSITGEYKASLIPYIYNIKKADLKIKNNSDIAILSSVETLNLLATPVLDSISYTTKDGTELFSEAFHHKKSFRYNSPVTLKLLEQQYETVFKIGENTYDVRSLDVPIYIQKKKYDITFDVSQDYVNKDGAENIITKEFFTEGTFNITNNLEVENKSTVMLNQSKTKYIYSFYAGEPNIAFEDAFKSAITVQYNITGSNALAISNDTDFKDEGIIKGGKSTGGVAFATIAPEVPDIILRDPPGSNSFASIEKGTTITYTKESANSTTDEDGVGFYASIGPDITISTGGLVLFTDVETSIVADAEGLLSKSITNTSQNVTTNSYTFNQTISTSDDIDFVGSDGDLYIGNAKNMYYGLFDNMFITEAPLKLTNGDVVPYKEITVKDKKDGADKTLYVSARKDRFIGEQPTKTFFSYSQKYIVETLIPELIAFADNFNPDNEPEGSLRTEKTYRNQANLWKRIIQDNEKTKFDAKNNKANYKQAILAKVNDFGEYTSQIRDLVNEGFFSNQSFDAGVGEFTSSVSTTVITGTSTEVNIETSEEFKEQLGGFVNNVGYNSVFTQIDSELDTDVFSSEEDVTTTISYTLKDNDQYNVLSVDVVNMFDGNGPVFITKAGSTSCPHEGEATSLFYKQAGYSSSVIGPGGEVLADATNSVYKPDVKAVKKVLTNIPESEGALFTLLLKNNSETQSDLEYIIEVDALTLNGATSNVQANGVNIYLPYNETIEFPFEVYKSSASSNFKYDNIRVYLKAPCDDINDSDGYIDVSVEFKKSCSKVTVSAPEDNFIFNRAEAYSKDANGNTTNNLLPITFTDFNTDFAGFKKIELQYRNASSANWTKFKTYYGTQQSLEDASDDSGEVIDAAIADYTFNWDVIGNQIPDGDYEFRAISYCTDDVQNISPIVSGSINLNAPVQFGTPQPSDGILDVGEDISIRFNEAVSKRIATSIKVSGLSNQQAIDHSVSVFLDGGVNQVELPNQILPNGSFTMQFWYKNATTGVGNLITQENGINATLVGNELTFSLGGASATGLVSSNEYNFYSLVYRSGSDPQLLILKNGSELVSETLTDDLDVNSNSSIFIGGNNVIGTIHDLRFWSKTFTPAQANVAKDRTLTGRELNLLGYWTLDEGHGKVGIDKAKSRNAIVNLDWDIKPKGTGYTFANNSYLSLENVGFVQPSVAEDMTLSFWIKSATASAGTVFSNGKGTEEDLLQTGGFRNKWSVNMTSDGNLELMSENISYELTGQSIADGAWHHVALVVKRGGSINAYVDALETSSVSSINIGGISGNKILVGARLYEDEVLPETIDNHFTGSLDEIRLWNTARSFEQIKRDRYFEIERSSEGLMLYTDFNQEDANTTKGPKYNHLIAVDPNTGIDRSSTFSILGGTTTQSYAQDSPALKPKLKFTNIPFTTVINGDQIIIQPTLTTEEWSLFEGQILDFSVSRLYDEHFNEQISPISWSAFVNKQEIEWFTANQTKEIVAEKNVNEAYSFTMDIVNKGGSNQGYTISGLPTWITVDNITEAVSPNATKQVVFEVDDELAMGTYSANIFLETASEFNDRLILDLRVLTPAPDWSVNAPDYSNSMNVIGKIKINEVFSRDQYTKIGAFVDNNPRGEAYLKYDEAYGSYFVYITAYSNVTSGEEVTFKIWDAINGQVLIAAIDGAPNTSFLQNEVLGSKPAPVIFSGAQFSEQTTALNKGWTWTSFFVEDNRFNDVKATFDGLALQDDDQIKSQNEFTRFENNNWFGSLNTIENIKMYKVNLADENSLRLIGNDVDETNVNLTINEGWNWLPFPIHRNISLQEALAFYNPTDGDVIKDQYNFAIYDATSGWSGTLNYMQSNRGYMMKSGASQTLNYPNSENAAKANPPGQEHAAETIALFSKYNGNMSVVAEIIANEKYSKVLVYDLEDNLRGESPIVTLQDRKMSFISVFSNTEDVLKFMLSDGNNEIDVTSGFVFENNNVYGNFVNPVLLNSKSLSTDEFLLNGIVLYPNPFSNELTVNSVNQIEKVTKIEVYSTIGALLLKVIVKTDETIIDTASFAKGIYLIKITSDAGHMIIKKMVKN